MISVREIDPEEQGKSAAARAATAGRWRAVVYDYRLQRTLVLEGRLGDTTPDRELVREFLPNPSPTEWTEARDALLDHPQLGPRLRAGELTAYRPMPPILSGGEGGRRRLVTVGLLPRLAGSDATHEIVGVDLAGGPTQRFAARAPDVSVAGLGPVCGAPPDARREHHRTGRARQLRRYDPPRLDGLLDLHRGPPFCLLGRCRQRRRATQRRLSRPQGPAPSACADPQRQVRRRRLRPLSRLAVPGEPSTRARHECGPGLPPGIGRTRHDHPERYRHRQLPGHGGLDQRRGDFPDRASWRRAGTATSANGPCTRTARSSPASASPPCRTAASATSITTTSTGASTSISAAPPATIVQQSSGSSWRLVPKETTAFRDATVRHALACRARADPAAKYEIRPNATDGRARTSPDWPFPVGDLVVPALSGERDRRRRRSASSAT